MPALLLRKAPLGLNIQHEPVHMQRQCDSVEERDRLVGVVVVDFVPEQRDVSETGGYEAGQVEAFDGWCSEVGEHPSIG